MIDFDDLSEWEIDIDDVEGELDMDKRCSHGRRLNKGRTLAVWAREEVEPHITGLLAEITRLRAELAAEMAVVDYYADGRSWHSIDDLYFYNRRDIVDKSDVDLTRPFNAGKRARARQAERGKECPRKTPSCWGWEVNAEELAMELAELRKQNRRIMKQVRINVDELQSRIAALEQLAEMVIDPRKMPHQHEDLQTRMHCLQERARELMEVKE